MLSYIPPPLKSLIAIGLPVSKCLVIGGNGFLGRHLAEVLVARGWTVAVFDKKITYPFHNVQLFCGDFCYKEDLLPALNGVDVVFHCAAPTPKRGSNELFYRVNYIGTKAVIKAMKSAGVKKLVLTSSADVVYDGSDIKNGEESMPYSRRPVDYFTFTKILQERMVLAASDMDFYTVAIRPHMLFGPHDRDVIPSIVEDNRFLKIKHRIGRGYNKIDFTYIENAVEGHVLAAEKLRKNSEICGQAYNITNEEPVYQSTFTSDILCGLGYKPTTYWIPYYLLLIFALILNHILEKISLVIKIKNVLPPGLVRLKGTTHFFSCAKARKELGYRPIVSLKWGIQKTLESFPHLQNKNTDLFAKILCLGNRIKTSIKMMFNIDYQPNQRNGNVNDVLFVKKEN